MRPLSLTLIFLLLINGCSHTRGYNPAPEKSAPPKAILNSFQSVGVIPATHQAYNHVLSLHDTKMAESVLTGTVEGALYGSDAVGDINCEGYICGAAYVVEGIVLIVGATVGAVYGAANAPQKPVAASDSQTQFANAAFDNNLLEISSKNNSITNALIESGDRLTPYSFISTVTPSSTVISKSAVDAYIRPSNYQIYLVGEQSEDPVLELVVKGYYSLVKSGYPDNCLGWYSMKWSGGKYKLSSWVNNEAASLKEEFNDAVTDLSNDAVAFLFNSDNSAKRLQSYDVYPPWLDCYEARNQKIIDAANWFCQSADNGIADSQRRIGDLYYRSGTSDGLINAYM